MRTWQSLLQASILTIMNRVDSPLMHMHPEQIERLVQEFVKDWDLKVHEETFLKVV